MQTDRQRPHLIFEIRLPANQEELLRHRDIRHVRRDPPIDTADRGVFAQQLIREGLDERPLTPRRHQTDQQLVPRAAMPDDEVAEKSLVCSRIVGRLSGALRQLSNVGDQPADRLRQQEAVVEIHDAPERTGGVVAQHQGIRRWPQRAEGQFSLVAIPPRILHGY
ncbi:MAG TPA: hypothetical protein DCP69_08690 [Candidatus Omnitrophica bacterium]|nr:hypothetical protein [Candidatus Omnitrophota bacterium]